MRPHPPGRSAGGAFFVAAGILLSRLAGLVRQRVFAHYFGLAPTPPTRSTAAFRIPNFLQNLFGEGALSASFIPVYAALRRARRAPRGRPRGRRRRARCSALVVAVLVLVGVVATPLLIDVDRAGLQRRQARADDRARPHPVSRAPACW